MIHRKSTQYDRPHYGHLLICFCELLATARQSAVRSLGSDILMGDLGFNGRLVTTEKHPWPQ